MGGFEVKGVGGSQQKGNEVPLRSSLTEGLKQLVEDKTLTQADASRLSAALSKIPFHYTLSDSVSYGQSMEQFWKLKDAPGLQNIPKLEEALNHLGNGLAKDRQNDLQYDAFSFDSPYRHEAQSLLLMQDQMRAQSARPTHLLPKAPEAPKAEAPPKATAPDLKDTVTIHVVKSGTAPPTMSLFDD